MDKASKSFFAGFAAEIEKIAKTEKGEDKPSFFGVHPTTSLQADIFENAKLPKDVRAKAILEYSKRRSKEQPISHTKALAGMGGLGAAVGAGSGALAEVSTHATMNKILGEVVRRRVPTYQGAGRAALKGGLKGALIGGGLGAGFGELARLGQKQEIKATKELAKAGPKGAKMLINVTG